MELSVTDTEFTKTTIINKISIDVLSIKLFESITFVVNYYNTDGVIIYDPSLIRTVEISNDEYRQWGEDDNYIVNLIKQKINMT